MYKMDEKDSVFESVDLQIDGSKLVGSVSVAWGSKIVSLWKKCFCKDNILEGL